MNMAQGVVTAGITRLIGNTPLLRVRMFERDFPKVEVYAKAEWFNPGGSVKDRAALSMIEDGERRGALTHKKTIIDSTSGNTGIAYALVGAAKGYRVKLVMPGNVSDERKALVIAYGAEIVYSDPLEGSDGAILKVRAGCRRSRHLLLSRPVFEPGELASALRGHGGRDHRADLRALDPLHCRTGHHRNICRQCAPAQGAQLINSHHRRAAGGLLSRTRGP